MGSKIITCLILTTYLAVQSTQTASVPKDEPFTVERANKYIAEHKGSVNQTYKPTYHVSAPIGWINDPNGFIYFKGE